ncbi:MAG: DEAD/DEAH box helicase [Candidatus Diapherotrites archaeon]|nr:DEAD/DEAH box helicase [Candidatus Diapherotrites archaeon]
MSFVEHPLIKKDLVENREYQEFLTARVLDKGNSLIVAPTALGKTIIAARVAAEILRKNPEGKILLLAPTKPLAEQHANSFKKVLKIAEEKIKCLTGTIKPEERKKEFEEATIITATPQTIENDLMNGNIYLGEVDLLVFDEAHKAVKDYSYVFIAQQYIKQNPKPLILGLTASPGGEEERIQDVCKNLFIKNIEIKTLQDDDVKSFVNLINVEWESVELPAEFLEIKKLLFEFNRDQVLALKRTGYGQGILPHFQRQKDLIELQYRIRRDMSSARKNPLIYQAAIKAAALLKVVHAITLLETQGITALSDYFEKMREKNSKADAAKSLAMIMKTPGIQKAIALTGELKEKGINHPKITKLIEILQNQFSTVPESKVLVFNHYRDSVKSLLQEFEKFPEIRAKKFIGQATKGKDKGLTQKEQAQLIKEFKAGEHNVLVCTSVAEEGIDIPQVDLVIFYEPVPSEIRLIQRRGRTGRLTEGKCIILMARGTRDEAFYWAANSKEKKMHSTLKKMRDAGNESPVLPKQSTLVKYMEDVKDKVLIYADFREQNSGIPEKLSEMQALVKLKQLEVGDFILTDEIAVERKSVEDFLQSMTDGRLFEQLSRLSVNYEKPLLLVEGNLEELYSLRNIHKNAIIGALTKIALDYKIPVLFSRNFQETAEFLHVIAKREQLGKEKDIRLRPGASKGLEFHEQQQFLIEGLPNIGPTLAKTLLEHFGSPEKLFSASEKDLQAAEGVGEKKAAEIRKVLEKKWTEKENQ